MSAIFWRSRLKSETACPQRHCKSIPRGQPFRTREARVASVPQLRDSLLSWPELFHFRHIGTHRRRDRFTIWLLCRMTTHHLTFLSAVYLKINTVSSVWTAHGAA